MQIAGIGRRRTGVNADTFNVPDREAEPAVITGVMLPKVTFKIESPTWVNAPLRLSELLADSEVVALLAVVKLFALNAPTWAKLSVPASTETAS
ncbi:hypothetical protein [Budvicia aquatica]|uniref:Uncharacterized protein n=1 Tax=Budvicia aquatica TaxID=82979 RepID=A0A484ZU41_9GAMM|nr:hypothetical protein [Budvicia aquatica]VFS50853.1 Uncharacterised protein [Budvicia aquatica]